MIILYLLSALWSFGCIALPLYMAAEVWRDGARVPAALAGAVALPLSFLLGAVPWGFMAEQAAPDLAVLKRGEWACTERTTTYTMVGKVLAPTTRCIEYRRLGK